MRETEIEEREDRTHGLTRGLRSRDMQTQNERALATVSHAGRERDPFGPRAAVRGRAVQFFKWEIFCCQDDEERENEGQRAASGLFTHKR